MRLPARRIATSALCATLLLGVTGSAAVAADSASAREGTGTHTASRAPVPDADELLGQVEALRDLGGVLPPATDLLNAVLKADDGQLPPSQAAKLGTGVKDAIAQATEAGSANPVTPPAPATPDPGARTTPDATPAAVPEGLAAEAMAALDKATDELLKAVTSDDAAKVTPAVNAVVAGLVDVIAATMLGSELPAPTLANLPSLPKTP